MHANPIVLWRNASTVLTLSKFTATNAFCFFFWKKKNPIISIGLKLFELSEIIFLLGARPQTPRVGFAEFAYKPTLFASFSGKRIIP
jgi:hypothetical protein